RWRARICSSACICISMSPRSLLTCCCRASSCWSMSRRPRLSRSRSSRSMRPASEAGSPSVTGACALAAAVKSRTPETRMTRAGIIAPGSVDDLHAAVLARRTFVVALHHRPLLAVARGADLGAVGAEQHHLALHGLRPAFAEGQVVLAGAALVCVAFEGYGERGVGGQECGMCLHRGAVLLTDLAAVVGRASCRERVHVPGRAPPPGLRMCRRRPGRLTQRTRGRA